MSQVKRFDELSGPLLESYNPDTAEDIVAVWASAMSAMLDMYLEASSDITEEGERTKAMAMLRLASLGSGLTKFFGNRVSFPTSMTSEKVREVAETVYNSTQLLLRKQLERVAEKASVAIC